MCYDCKCQGARRKRTEYREGNKNATQERDRISKPRHSPGDKLNATRRQPPTE